MTIEEEINTLEETEVTFLILSLLEQVAGLKENLCYYNPDE